MFLKDENNTLYECYFDDYAWVPSFTKLQVQIKSENGGFVPIQGFAEAPITGVIGSVDEADKAFDALVHNDGTLKKVLIEM